MRRRDISKVLLASAAGAALPAARGETMAAKAADLPAALAARGEVRIAAGQYAVTSKLQTLVSNNIVGDSREDTMLLPSSFSDYVLEVGNGKPGPNNGRIARLRFKGAAGNLGCLHMNSLSHMWHLDDLLFSGGPCPALVVDNCWDSNYTNIDILGHITPGGEPAKTAAVIFRNGCNNIYCRGLRIEAGHSGGIYADCQPLYIVMGKIDDGFGGPQTAAAITVTATGYVTLDDFYIGGVRDQFLIDVAGHLKLGRVLLDGGSNKPAAIYDHRPWRHVDVETDDPAGSAASMGPEMASLDLGGAEFRRTHPSVETETPAAVYSRIHPIRQVMNLRTIANGAVSGNSIMIGTSLHPAHNDVYRGSFLVHNSSGTRRRILTSFVGGNVVLEGPQPVTLDEDWSVEYCENHYTPIEHENIRLQRGQTLFAVVSSKILIASELVYVARPSDAAYGTTKFKISGLEPGHDVRGLFLIDNITSESYYIQYGVDPRGYIGVMYDRRGALTANDEFSIVAGHSKLEAARRPRLARLSVAAAGIGLDLSVADEFEITATVAGPIAIAEPINAAARAGQRISITLRNSSGAALAGVTWGDAYKLAPWVSPAAGYSRSIDFRHSGKNWVEVARTQADVPN
jgi:hypothetical protein